MLRRGYNRAPLDDIIDHLCVGKTLPLTARLHRLSGEWEGFWECHIQPDWLLVYVMNEVELNLARTGTHADIFNL
mgnify:CR=1 FL=1